ncbi:unnamed protein product, partial [Mesorhabditis belari]|uniref:P/Homo B domain-containing protein n=1 Tax=Mesorhabditis belari TaxID=2138241 RepID=A0AAF3ED01_9BILA
MKRRKLLDFWLLWTVFGLTLGDFRASNERRENLEILLETLEDRVLTLQEEILRREKSNENLKSFSQIAVDSGGLQMGKLEEILRENHFEIVAKHPTLPNIFLAERIRAKREKRSANDRGKIESWTKFEAQFDWIEPLNTLEIQKRVVDSKKEISCNDPHFQRQSPQFDKMGFTKAWARGLSGNGITIAVVDDGVEFKASKELSSASQKSLSQSIFGSESLDDDLYMHGTQCAGVIAMRANNSECGVGGAPKATIIDVPLLSRIVTDFSESVALSQKADIFTCSWGPPDDGMSAEGPLKLTRTVIEKQTKEGRNGLGSLFVWASGNGGTSGDDCSLDGFVSNPMTIAVGWTFWNSSRTEWSEGCPAILTSVISDQFGGQVSVNGKGECVPSFRGSSAAAPLAAAGLALLLEKFPKLSRREVTHLVVRGSDPTHFTAFEKQKWNKNAAGLQFNKYLGFGILSVDRMLNLAPILRSPFPAMQECSEGYKVENRKGSLNDFSARLPFNGCEQIEHLETILLSIRLTHPRRGDLQIRLKSPSGTLLTLLDNRPFDKYPDLDWTFTVNHFWGENPNGDWTISFFEKGIDKALGQVQALSLTVRGTKEHPFEFEESGKLTEIANRNFAIGSSGKMWNVILGLLIIVLACLLVYGGFEYLAIRRKAKRCDASWRILNEERDEYRHNYKHVVHPPSENDDDHLLVNEAFINED